MNAVQTNPTGSRRTKQRGMSGKRLFFLYTWPCVNHKIVGNNQKISEEVFLRLKKIKQDGSEPDIKIFENYFPGPLKKYLDLCQKTGKGPWSYDSVSEYWRKHHVHDEEKGGLKHDLFEGEITEISPDKKIATIEVGNRHFPAINAHDQDIERGDRVSVHKNIIIEIL